MLKDRFIETARDPACAYAVDGIDGGRFLSPIRPDRPEWPHPGTPWNYVADGACSWYGFKAAATAGHDLRFSIEFTAHAYGAEKTFVFSSTTYGAYSPFGIRLNNATACYLGGLFGATAASFAYNNPAFNIAIMGNSGSLYLYWRDFALGERYQIVFELAGNEYTVFINGERAAACTLTGTDLSRFTAPTYQSNADGEIFDIEYKDLTAGEALFRYGTWETRHGLLTPFNLKTVDGRFVADNAAYTGYLATPLDLRARSSDFTLIWRGVIGNGGPLILQGDSYASAMYLTYNKTGKYLEFAVGNGANTVVANFTTEDVGEQVVACAANFTALEARLYVDGVLKSSKPIPADFGGLASNMTRKQLAAYPGGGLRGFSMFDYAISAEEARTML